MHKRSLKSTLSVQICCPYITWTSVTVFKSLELDTDSSRGSRDSLDSLASSVVDDLSSDKSPRLFRKEKLCNKVSDTSTCSLPSTRITSLLLVIHGGTQIDTGLDPTSRDMDFKLIQDAFDAVINSHYRGAVGRIALRLVECPAICSKALNLLSQLCTYSESDSDVASINSGFTPVSSSFPLSAISLMVSSSPFYDEAVNAMVVATNMVYQDFLKSEEGQGFRGEVCLLGDCMGALLAYDALTTSVNTLKNRTQSFITNTAMLSPNPPHLRLSTTQRQTGACQENHGASVATRRPVRATWRTRTPFG
ncbi:Membrane-associated phosphatidylinositol transfer protein 2 [Desmophyllum pertusum]|uniref:Membrane-associated phosphatidylinositol transfer protein 2 n=1 Tax=Desmophyllum pertusum TaxID=174260 RepID=A0A9W9ZSQ3_9CNID|nr:Membrane-associated phosphatidylinositol transfer protein 2 [Desmophyllum pertusum]